MPGKGFRTQGLARGEGTVFEYFRHIHLGVFRYRKTVWKCSEHFLPVDFVETVSLEFRCSFRSGDVCV